MLSYSIVLYTINSSKDQNWNVTIRSLAIRLCRKYKNKGLTVNVAQSARMLLGIYGKTTTTRVKMHNQPADCAKCTE